MLGSLKGNRAGSDSGCFVDLGKNEIALNWCMEAGIWAGICGELGADQSLTKEFLAMGVDELSVSPGSILPLRKIILETNVTDYKAGKEC